MAIRPLPEKKVEEVIYNAGHVKEDLQNEETRTTISLRVPNSLLEAIEEEQKRTFLSRSSIIIQALLKYLNDR